MENSFESHSIIINGYRIQLEIGHTKNEWNRIYGTEEYLWDICLEDFISGALEPDENMVYWYINGRLYETT